MPEHLGGADPAALSREVLERALKASAPPANLAVNTLLGDAHEQAKTDITTPVEIEDVDTFPSLEKLYVDKRKWLRVKNVVAVAADLKESTSLSFGKYAQTSARLYEAVTGRAVKIMSTFGPEFIDIQGDGLFGLFHGERAFERGMCAAITLKTFSARSIGPLIDEHFADSFPDTGLKVGVASGTIVAKKVGVRGTNEPVWAGKPVNWAVKCAQRADRHEVVATAAVYDKLADNEYITHSCGCPHGTPVYLWRDVYVEKLGKHAACKLLPTGWCREHGDEFCRAILAGEKGRDLGLSAAA